MAVGLVGLGVMGRNLALNWRDTGQAVFATDSWATARAWRADGVTILDDTSALVAALPTPRVILLMVKAGEQVDLEIDALAPQLSPGDVILDGGNSNFRDTERRAASLGARGIGFLGVGISGGAEGARHGAALMVGGSEAAWGKARPMLGAVAASAKDDALTVDRFGEGGAGHFVKMVHNGIEYAIMQAIAEAHMLLIQGIGLSADEAAAVFARWNGAGRGAGFLLEITAEIAGATDPLGEGALLDKISDVAGQKGTGGWTINAGVEHGVAIPSIMEAVTARQLSGEGRARAVMAEADLPRGALDRGMIDDIEAALIGTMIAALSQGVHLYAVAAAAHGWHGDLARVLRVWRAGSILRMDLLDMLADAVADAPDAILPIEIPSVAADLAALVSQWRGVVSASVENGYPLAVLGGTLAYVDALGVRHLPTAMVQAQRDRFGAHGFGRTDREGQHHGPWVHPDQDARS